MKARRFLLGNRRDKQEIEQLLFKNLPGNVSFEYTYLCNALIQDLYEEDASSIDDYDYAVCEFLYELKIDVQERLKGYWKDFEQYLLDVEKALEYFRTYLCQIDCFPLPCSLYAEEGTNGTVMQLVVYN